MTAPRSSCLVYLALCLLAESAAAQYTIKKIVFDNPGSYTQVALEAASGLKAGDALTTEGLQKSAQKLVDTGAFDDVQVTLDGPMKAISVLFKIKPLDPAHRLTVAFDNFVWFTPEEREAGLHSRIPLYDTALPEAGNLQDAVEAALVELLQAKGIPATLTHQVYEPSSDSPLRIVAYRVKSPVVVLHATRLKGVTTEFAAAIHDTATKIVGKPYNEGPERPTTVDALLAPYRNAGYLDAGLNARTLTLLTPATDRANVDLGGEVVPGTLFHIGQISWTGSPEISAPAFAAAVPLHTGDLASALAVAKAVDLLATPYRAEGYNDVLVGTGAVLDKSAGTVAYTFTVTPGAVYRVRSVTPLNLSATQQTDFARGWRLKPGDIYNPEYIKSFLKQNTALQSFAEYSASYKAVSDPETHLVDVTLNFVRGTQASH